MADPIPILPRIRRRNNLSMPQLLPIPDAITQRQNSDRSHERPIYTSPSFRPAAPRPAPISILSPIYSPDATHFVFNMDPEAMETQHAPSDNTLIDSISDSLASPLGSPYPLNYADHSFPGQDEHWWSPISQATSPLSPMSSPIQTRLYEFPEFASQESVNAFSHTVDNEPIVHDAALAFDARLPAAGIPLQVSAALGAMTRAVDWVIVALPLAYDAAHEAMDTLIQTHQLPPSKLVVLWSADTPLGPIRCLDLVHRYGLGGVFTYTAADLASASRHICKPQRTLSHAILSQRLRLRLQFTRSGDVPEAAYHVYAPPNNAGAVHIDKAAGIHFRLPHHMQHAPISTHCGKLGLPLLKHLHAGVAHGRS